MRRAAALAALLTLAGCDARGGRAAIPVPAASPSPFGDLGALVSQASPASQDDAEVRELLRRPVAMRFPASVGVLFYAYAPPVLAEERRHDVGHLCASLVASGVALQATELPTSLGQQAGLDALRKFAARLQLDALVLVSGRSSFTRSEVQPGGFFAAFGSGANHEARTSLTAFTLDVWSGVVLPPVTGQGSTSPALLDPALEDFVPARRRLVRAAFADALAELGRALQGSLQTARDAQAGATR